MEGNLHFKIDWGSRIVGREFTVFTLFILYLRTISKYKPPGGLYLEGLIFGILRYLQLKFLLYCIRSMREPHAVHSRNL